LFITLLVKSSEFKRWLADQGATFKPGKGSHLKVTLNGKNSVLPMHVKELGTGVGGGHQETAWAQIGRTSCDTQ
jgi:mRNA interferase HicA